MKLTRRIAMAGVSAAIAGGAVLATGGAATAAPTPAPGHVPAPHAAVRTDTHCQGHGTARQATDPWIEGQIATFYPSAAHRLAVFDPWVKDQLATFGTAGQ
ncbi:hypothetical protein AQJ66_34395 [Streptomyces bungoensis]|uniref:Uncharacterized protein n=1 Tax=Streptomyces bungoensis TaxID=285568 RepID=A0A124I1E0_9ACTN|nr:hypothetical protein [Streptomyces bungoensis]KUN77051.1 hypothetical protein AQJ66_34395 [Streptomyces bungoensis]